jgi:hypothetical protein
LVRNSALLKHETKKRSKPECLDHWHAEFLQFEKPADQRYRSKWRFDLWMIIIAIVDCHVEQLQQLSEAQNLSDAVPVKKIKSSRKIQDCH